LASRDDAVEVVRSVDGEARSRVEGARMEEATRGGGGFDCRFACCPGKEGRRGDG
jgi:hypothetical protein